MFPSPCGEKVGINPNQLDVGQHGLGGNVSVPLRGKGRDQPSVTWRSKAEEKFPSPCGEKVGINMLDNLDWYATPGGVSVPLRGKGRDQPLLR